MKAPDPNDILRNEGPAALREARDRSAKSASQREKMNGGRHLQTTLP